MSDEFRQSIMDAGLMPPDYIQPGRFHRFPGEGKQNGNKAGWCVLFEDATGGVYGDWSTGYEQTWFINKNPSHAERKEAIEQARRAKQEYAQEKKKKQATAAIHAKEKWNSVIPEIGEHKYLRDKGVKPHGIRTDGLNLLIPMYAEGKLHSLQTIPPTGDKMYLKGGRKKGCYYPIGKPNGVMCLAEGFATGATIHEATGHAVAVCFDTSNLQPVAEALSRKYTDIQYIICADDDSMTDGNPGITKATEAAVVCDGVVAVPDFNGQGEGNTDFNDMARLFGLDNVKAIINMALESDPVEPNTDAVVERLAKLTPLEYDKVRDAEAKHLNVRVKTLDVEVAKRRGDIAEDTVISVVEEINPYESTVDGDLLLSEMASTLNKYVYLPKNADTAISVWCLGTFCMDAWQLFPKCLITSPEKRCGKTTLIDTMEGLTYRALVASNISPSAIFRSIEEWCPTLFLDEADTFAKDNPELNGIINAGHRKRSAKIIRSEKVADAFLPKAFSVWAAQVIAGIGDQRSTLHDRSIHIEMERKLPDEKVSKLPTDFFEQHEKLRRKCLRWAEDNISTLRAHSVAIPNYGNDRAQDNWEPLVRLAMVAGGDWSKKVLDAYKTFSVDEDDYEDAGILLLRDIKLIFEKKDCDKIASADLVDHLIDIEDSPWFEWKKGKPLTQNSLSRLLKPFKIKPTGVRIGSGTPRGYKLKQFKSVFDRYVAVQSATQFKGETGGESPSRVDQSATPQQTPPDAGFSDFQSATTDANVALSKRRKSPPVADCCGVALQKGGNGKPTPKTPDSDLETTI